MITGASSGIGYELAKLFAKDKHNLVLIARREKGLNDLANSLVKKHGIESKNIAKDLSRPNSAQEIYEVLEEKNISVGFLVNNVG